MDASRKLYSYLASQMERKDKSGIPGFVTISRQAGAGGMTIGEKVAAYLNAALPDKCPWTVFDKNLVEEIVKEHNLSEKTRPYLKEETISLGESAIDVLINLRSVQATLVEKINRTILHLSRMGRVILVGRGASSVTRFTEGGSHIRLVGSPKNRKKHLQEYFNLTAKEAKDFMEKEDGGRARYLKKYFEQDIDDPLLYDLVINTDNISYDAAAMIIKDMVIRRIKS